MKISSSLEDYIEAISEIIEQKGHAHTKNIAEKLNVKMPSATNALQVLREHKLIEYQAHAPVTLTTKGASIGAVIRRRHKNLQMFFTKILQLDEESANTVACKIEHVIGENISSRLAFLAETINESPECEKLREILAVNMSRISIENDSIPIILSEVEDGESCVIFKIDESLKGIRKFSDLGLVKGTLLKMEGRAPFGNLLRIRVMGSSLSIRAQDAKHILVKRTFEI